MWPGLCADLAQGVAKAAVARRFHLGLADGWCALIGHFGKKLDCATVAYFRTGCCWRLWPRLAALGLTVWIPAQIPVNDGGLAVGQALVAAAQQEE